MIKMEADNNINKVINNRNMIKMEADNNINKVINNRNIKTNQ
jgi:hypothetical protein